MDAGDKIVSVASIDRARVGRTGAGLARSKNLRGADASLGAFKAKRAAIEPILDAPSTSFGYAAGAKDVV